MRRTPMRRQSEKRKQEKGDRDRVQSETLRRAGYRCEAAELVPEVECRGGLDTDEIVLRSGRSGGHLDKLNTQAVCRPHHDWKHDNPEEAERRGLRLWSWDDGDSPREIVATKQAEYLARR